MHAGRLIALVLAAALAGISCGKKAEAPGLFILCGTETLSAVTLAPFSPDSITNAAGLSRAAHVRQLTLAVDLESDTLAAADLAELLARESNVEWSGERRMSIHRACRGAFALSAQQASATGIIDSLAAELHETVAHPADTADRLIVILSYIIPDAGVAAQIADFLRSESTAAISADDTKKLISGLVGTGKKATPAAVRSNAPKPTITGNMKELLKYRPEAAIRDTMIRHLPYLEGIYRKELKIEPTMSGTIWITFTIAPSGRVNAASVTRSDIRRRELLDQVLGYARGIAFGAVPEKAGPMTFDFPFEFHPE